MSISDFQGGKWALEPGQAGPSLNFWKKKVIYYEHFWFKVSFHACFFEAAE